MRNRRSGQELDITELEQRLWQKKQQTYPARRQRLKAMGRLVEAPGLAPANAAARRGARGRQAETTGEHRNRGASRIVISSERQAYRYVVRETVIVEPTDVSVMAQTDYATLTLISCYPYRINTQRIVVFADLAVS